MKMPLGDSYIVQYGSIPLDSTTHIYCQLRIEQSRSFRLALLKIGHARNKTKTKLSCHL